VGAAGYVLKESVLEELVEAIHTVVRGETFLSAQIPGGVTSRYQAPAPEATRGTTEREAEGSAAEPILRTKLYRPALPGDLVPRTRVMEQLEAGWVRPLTLISAPAGYGKSLLVSSWLKRCEHASAWFSLDQSDSELRPFMRYFVAAVQGAFATACTKTLELVNAPRLPSLSTLAASLGRELDAIDRPIILVLDDYHRIDANSPVNDLLDKLLAHPTLTLHLVIITRRDPPLQLLTLRARGQMSEIQLQDLRFEQSESKALLENSLGFRASDRALANLQHETEGWVVGLRLVSLALRQIENRDSFLEGLHGGIQQTQAYLLQQVIAQQSPPMQAWLLRTAILDRFCSPLCGAIGAAEPTTGGAPGIDSDQFIEGLLSGNLFTIPLDARGEWFRYHHLFQHLLQRELKNQMSPDEIAGLHSRASHWFESQGLIEEAIQHALKAGNVVTAAEIFERHQQAELDLDRWYVVEGWLAMLPAEIIQQRPRLLLTQMWGLYNQYRLLEIPPLLARAESLLTDEAADESLLGEAHFYRGLLLTSFQGDPEGALIQFEQARKRPSRSQRMTIGGTLEILVAMARQMAGEGALAIHSLDQKIHAMGSRKGLFLAKLIMGQVIIHLLSADLAGAAGAAQRCTTVCHKTGIVNLEAWSHYLRANADLQSYHLDDALQGFQYAVKKQDILHRKAAIETWVGLVLTYQAMQRSDDAVDAMEQLMAFALDTDEPQHIAVAQSCRARLSLLQGDSKSAIDWARSYDVKAHAPSMLMWMEIPLVTQIRITVATGSHEKLQQTSKLLTALSQSARAIRNSYQSIDLLLLQSLALEKLGRTEGALEPLQQAVELAEPGRWIRPFVELGRPMAELLEQLADQKGSTEYLGSILDHIQTAEQPLASITAGGSGTITDSQARVTESLTNRELDTLELLAQRLRNKEIAARLFVSPETVKTHLKHLYQKLGVNNRREAATMAAEVISPRAAHGDT
jgi:LuxR family maltose regulon positive regulatory protein